MEIETQARISELRTMVESITDTLQVMNQRLTALEHPVSPLIGKRVRLRYLGQTTGPVGTIKRLSDDIIGSLATVQFDDEEQDIFINNLEILE